MKKNVAGQHVSVVLKNAIDGTDFTGTAIVNVDKDGAGDVASAGTIAYIANGRHRYTPTQAETNADDIVFTFSAAGVLSASAQVYTSFPQTADHTSPIAALPTAAAITDAVWDEDIVAAHNTPDSAGRILSNTANLANGSGGISTVMNTFTKTQGGTETNTEAATTELNETLHIVPANGTPEIDIEYEFSVGTTGAATEIIWDGYVTTNNDNAEVYGWDYVAASYKQVGNISGGSANVTEHTFLFTAAMTGTGADAGKVRFRIASVGGDVATVVATDRVLCEFTALPEAGRFLHTGIAVSATANTIVFDTSANTTDGFYNHTKVVVSSGLGSEQERLVVHYDGATRTAKVAHPWVIIPDSTSAFEVEPALAHAETGWSTIHVGIAVAATSTTITLDGDASSVDDFYKDELVHIDSGTGAGQRSIIIGYVGSTKVATVHTTWIVTPDTTSEYIIEEGHPYIDVASSSLSAQITALPSDILTTALAEVYPADGVAPTVQQALMLIQQTIGDFAISGTTMTVKKLDGTTTAATYTLDDAANPTSRTRAT